MVSLGTGWGGVKEGGGETEGENGLLVIVAPPGAIG